MELSDCSTQTADDTSSADYALPRQSGQTSPDAPLLQLTGSQKPIKTAKVAPRRRGCYATRASVKKKTTMSIPLGQIEMVQLFLRAADGSVKGICFDYKDGDMVDFGCCVAEPGCWYMWKRPQWLLFKPAKDRAVSRSRGFIPIEEIGFVDMYDCPETRMNSICMRERDPLGFRLSKKGLEIDLWFQERFYERVLERAKRIFERRLETESGLQGCPQEYGRLETESLV